MTPEELRDRAQDILDRSEFAEPERSWFQRALDRIFEWLGDLIADALGLLGVGGVGGGFAWLLLGIVAVVLIVVIVRAIVDWQAAPDREGTTVSTSSSKRLTAAQWRERARQHAAAGEWDDAVRCHHRATVVELSERLETDDAPGSTARQWRERAASAHLADVSELTDLFEGVWYGGESADPSAVTVAERDPFGGVGS